MQDWLLKMLHQRLILTIQVTGKTKKCCCIEEQKQKPSKVWYFLKVGNLKRASDDLDEQDDESSQK